MRRNAYDGYDATFPAAVRIRAGDFATADRTARAVLENPRDEESAWQARWILFLGLRYQARWREADSLLRGWRGSLSGFERAGERGRLLATMTGLLALEAGDAAAAVATFDSVTAHPEAAASPGVKARFLTLQYTLLADAAAAAGEMAIVERAVDSALAWAARSGKTRDLRIAMHAHAVRQLAQGDTAAAMTTLRGAIYSRTVGFTRTSARLAALLLQRGHPREAVEFAAPALRGSLESANLYVTHTELHELLARSFLALGERDSAGAHYRYVAAALAAADSGARPRLAAARAALAGREP
jgi:hypothetical protein